MSSLRAKARAVKKAGRKGDTHLIHITEKELLALQATGKVTRNPKTGLPEAFAFSAEMTPGAQAPAANATPFTPNVSLADRITQGQALAKTNSDAAYYVSQGAIPFQFNIGDQLFAPGGGALYPGYTYYNGGDMGAFVPAQGGVPTNPNFIAKPQENRGLLSGGLSDDLSDMRGGLSVMAAALGGYMFAGAGAAGAATSAPEFTGADAALGNAASSTGTVSSASGLGTAMPAATPEPGGDPTSFGGSAFQGMPPATASAMPAAVPEPSGGPTAPGGSAATPIPSAAADPSAGLPGSAPDTTGAVDAAFGNGSGGAPGSGGFSMGVPSLLSAYNMGTGLYGLYEAEQMKKAAKQPQVYDPFAGQRAQYQQQLAALSADPSLITKDPGYTSGLQAVQRTMAAQGYLGSGNMMTELANFGGNFYNNAVTRLSNLAGASISPMRTDNSAMVNANAQFSRSLASIGFGLAQMAA